MIALSAQQITEQIVAKAISLGANLAGVASVELLKHSPSHLLYPQMDLSDGIGMRKTAEGIEPGKVAWPRDAKSAVVIAVEHKKDQPELDWWYGRKSPPGNRILMKINNALVNFVEENLNITAHNLPYHIEFGGIFLKDAAVMAGLGCIGKNNILVTPEYGPRVRLRAILLDLQIAATGPIDFDPCGACDEPCRKACPEKAFENIVFSAAELGLEHLPARTGCYVRSTCNLQMLKNNEDAVEDIDPESGGLEKIIKYCRRCELACPVG